jgi:hypothetical protein
MFVPNGVDPGSTISYNSVCIAARHSDSSPDNKACFKVGLSL